MSMRSTGECSHTLRGPQFHILCHPGIKPCSHLPFFQRRPAEAGRKRDDAIVHDAKVYIFCLFTEKTLAEVERIAHEVDAPSRCLKKRLGETFPGRLDLTIFQVEAELFNVFFSYLEDPIGHIMVAILDIGLNRARC